MAVGPIAGPAAASTNEVARRTDRYEPSRKRFPCDTASADSADGCCGPKSVSFEVGLAGRAQRFGDVLQECGVWSTLWLRFECVLEAYRSGSEGEEDEVDAVAGVGFGQEIADMRLDGGHR